MLKTGDKLLAVVLRDPADDTPRLVYADWLEESAGTVVCPSCNGCNVKFLGTHLVGKARAASPCPDCSGTGRVPDGRPERAEFIRVQCELNANPPSMSDRWQRNARWFALRDRERELLDAYRLSWFGGWEGKITRGFLSAVTCTAGDWYTHGRALLAREPIEQATVDGATFTVRDGELYTEDGGRVLLFADGGVAFKYTSIGGARSGDNLRK